MTDDPWRSRQDDEDDDFGPPLFADERDAGPTERLSFGNHTGALPHWTEPPTGELPVFEDQIDSTEDLDVWSSFSGDATTWSDDAPTGGTSWADDDSAGHETPATQVNPVVAPPVAAAPERPVQRPVERAPERPTGRRAARSAARADRRAPIDDDFADLADLDDMAPVFEREPVPAPVPELDDYLDVAEFDEPAPPPAPRRREPGRITIGTDPTDGAMSRPTPTTRRQRPTDAVARGPRPPRPAPGGRGPGGPGGPGRRPQGRPAGGIGGRDMPTAIGVGLGIAIVFIAALKIGAALTAVIVVAVLGLASIEFFDRVREKGYQPAFIPGIMACVAAPVAVYHYGVGALPLVMVFTFIACSISFVGAQGLDSNPMPNMAITTLGIAWIGMLGSFGAAILGTRVLDHPNVGTDTLFLLAVGVVANDVGALFVGSAVGRTPLRPWISPNKSIEGFIGGTIATLGVMMLIGIFDLSDSWNSVGELLLLGIVVSIMAPVGDLTESMFKRNLDVKDFGSLVRGHGGVLDRFDGFLFVMPAVYYLAEYLQPWLSK